MRTQWPANIQVVFFAMRLLPSPRRRVLRSIFTKGRPLATLLPWNPEAFGSRRCRHGHRIRKLLPLELDVRLRRSGDGEAKPATDDQQPEKAHADSADQSIDHNPRLVLLIGRDGWIKDS